MNCAAHARVPLILLTPFPYGLPVPNQPPPILLSPGLFSILVHDTDFLQTRRIVSELFVCPCLLSQLLTGLAPYPSFWSLVPLPASVFPYLQGPFLPYPLAPLYQINPRPELEMIVAGPQIALCLESLSP